MEYSHINENLPENAPNLQSALILNEESRDPVHAAIPLDKGASLILPNYIEDALKRSHSVSSCLAEDVGRRSVSVLGHPPDELTQRQLKAQQQENLVAHNQERAQKYKGLQKV